MNGFKRFFSAVILLLTGCTGFGTPSVSVPAPIPDFFKLYFISYRDGQRELYMMEPDGSDQKRLTHNEGTVDYAVASPDEKLVAFVLDVKGNRDIFRMNADGTDVRQLTHTPAAETSPRWSPDGKKIVFISDQDGGNAGRVTAGEVYIMNADGTAIKRLTFAGKGEDDPSWSPDGRYILFTSQRDGNQEVYIMNLDGSDQRNLSKSPALDWNPFWSPDGKKIGFVTTR
ncbi:MAG: PD40 domain-containing protein, partial [Nitrospirae bacterium]|nr:PD40 domain-containing protein [Nitrospirota bacterium]